jgi:hypothetical protein
MESKYEAEIEIQLRQLDADSSEERCHQTGNATDSWIAPVTKSNTLKEDWDAPHNMENPRNWSSCKRYNFDFTPREQKLTFPKSRRPVTSSQYRCYASA